VSACIAGYESIDRLINPRAPDYLLVLAAAGLLGFIGNWLAAGVRTRAGRRLDSPALIADGAHARADAYVSLAVVASAVVVALGLEIADPLIGLGITAVILRITFDSWRVVSAAKETTPADCASSPRLCEPLDCLEELAALLVGFGGVAGG
jgi:divalent metal cation (Fe/Co/Zn/Cd) transporter